MQSSDQQPEARDVGEQAGGEAEEYKKREEQVEQDASQPLYEFPPHGSVLNIASLPAPITQVLPTGELANLSLEEAVRQGLVYPPPPAYYQNMPEVSEQLPLPQHKKSAAERPGAGESSVPVPADIAYAPPAQMYQGNMQAYAPPVAYPQYMPQPPVKKSRRWIWILVISVSVFVLGSCGLCAWAFFGLFNSTYQQVSGSLQVVNDYYTNLQSSHYTAAYSDLDINGLTQDAFTQQAILQDTQYGPVLSFVEGQPSFQNDPNTGPDLSHITITVDIKRAHSSYTALLKLSDVRGSWKITYYDRL